MPNIRTSALSFISFSFFIVACASETKCGKETIYSGFYAINATGKSLEFAVQTPVSLFYTTPDRSQLQSYSVALEATDTDVRYLPLFSREESLLAPTKFGPPVCKQQTSNPNTVVAVSFSSEFLSNYVLCRSNNGYPETFTVKTLGQTCDLEKEVYLSDEANSPVNVNNDDFSRTKSEECSSVRVSETSVNNILDEYPLKAVGSVVFQCAFKKWEPYFNCFDPMFTPELSENGGAGHCSDEFGNIRKIDSWNKDFGDSFFCHSSRKDRWISIYLPKKRETYYHYCSKPSTILPWPDNAGSEAFEFKQCPLGQTALFATDQTAFECVTKGP